MTKIKKTAISSLLLFSFLLFSGCTKNTDHERSTDDVKYAFWKDLVSESAHAESENTSTIGSVSFEASRSVTSNDDVVLEEWTLRHYVDEFGDETFSKYVGYIGSGSFSNTATTDSTLFFSVMIDNTNFAVKLLEYGSSVVLNSYSHRKNYEITIKTENGLKKSFSGFMMSDSGDRVYINNRIDLINLLNSNKTLTFLIIDSERPTSKYKFTVDCSNFSEVYTQL